MAAAARVVKLGEQSGEVEWLAVEDELTIFARPLVRRSIPGKLHTVEVRVVHIDGLVRTVIRSPIDAPAAGLAERLAAERLLSQS